MISNIIKIVDNPVLFNDNDPRLTIPIDSSKSAVLVLITGTTTEYKTFMIRKNVDNMSLSSIILVNSIIDELFSRKIIVNKYDLSQLYFLTCHDLTVHDYYVNDTYYIKDSFIVDNTLDYKYDNSYQVVNYLTDAAGNKKIYNDPIINSTIISILDKYLTVNQVSRQETVNSIVNSNDCSIIDNGLIVFN